MKRLHFLVEGHTEREFVDSVLVDHFAAKGIICDARIVTTSHDWSSGRVYKGGIVSYCRLRNEIVNSIRQDCGPDSYFTTFFDLYGLPTDFPGMSGSMPPDHKMLAEGIESALLSDIKSALPLVNVGSIFIPNVLCHEFETLVLSDASKLGNYYFDRKDAIVDLSKQVDEVGDPELVDSGVESAPSKRILRAIPEYDKSAAGALVALDIGLQSLRARCARFNAWITRLETIGGTPL